MHRTHPMCPDTKFARADNVCCYACKSCSQRFVCSTAKVRPVVSHAHHLLEIYRIFSGKKKFDFGKQPQTLEGE